MLRYTAQLSVILDQMYGIGSESVNHQSQEMWNPFIVYLSSMVKIDVKDYTKIMGGFSIKKIKNWYRHLLIEIPNTRKVIKGYNEVRQIYKYEELVEIIIEELKKYIKESKNKEKAATSIVDSIDTFLLMPRDIYELKEELTGVNLKK